MPYRIGQGYLGSKQVETSTANQEVIPESPSHWTVPYSCYKFELINDSECTLVINHETELYRRAGQGFIVDSIDKPITSCVIKESGITYTFTAAY